MRVLHLIDSLASHGAERSLVDLAPYLLDRGIQYEVAFLRDPDELSGQLIAAGVRLHDLRGPDNRTSHTSRALTLFAALEPTLVHTTLYRSDIAGRTAAKSLGIPVVSTWASTGPEDGGRMQQVKRKRTDAIDRWTAQYATRFHAVSDAVAEAVGTRLGVEADRIDVIPRGRDAHRLLDRTSHRSGTARDRLGLTTEPVVLALARHVHAKGLDILVDAAAVVHSNIPDLTVLIAGETGAETEQLNGRIASRGLERNVRILGPRQDVGALLAAANVAAVPSRVEGFPGTVVESMMSGTPVVASDLSSIRAALPDQTMGWLVRPEDPLDLSRALEQALTHPTSGQDRAAIAKRHALMHFSLPAVADSTIAFYERALQAATSVVA